MKFLRKNTFSFLVPGVAMLAISGCETLQSGAFGDVVAQVSSGNFPVSVAIERQTIDGAGNSLVESCEADSLSLLDTNAVSDVAIDIASEQEMAGKGGIAVLKSLTVNNIKLQIVDVPEGDSDNFDFLNAIAFYGKGAEGEQLIAQLDPVPRGATEITVPGTDFNLKQMASSESFKVVTKAKGRLPCDDVNLVGSANFLAKPL